MINITRDLKILMPNHKTRVSSNSQEHHKELNSMYLQYTMHLLAVSLFKPDAFVFALPWMLLTSHFSPHTPA